MNHFKDNIESNKQNKSVKEKGNIIKQVKPCSYDEFIFEFKTWTDTWYRKIQLSVDRNLSLFPGNTGDYGELFGSLITGKLGTQSGGSGFDLSNGVTADEAKMCIWVQPQKCKCGTDKQQKTLSFFKNEKCECGRDFKYVHDSRWGIDSKAGVEYNDLLDNYIIQLIEPVKYSHDNMEFIYSCYFIDGKDKNFHEYLVNQNEKSNKSNNCNLVPYSFDFYRGHPKLKVRLNIILTENDSIIEKVFWNLNNEKVEKMPFSVLKQNEILLLDNSFKVVNIKENLMNLEKNFNGNPADFLPLRNKNLDKDRGVTSRKI